MRPIKFRAWDKVNKEFVTLTNLNFISHGDLISVSTRKYGFSSDTTRSSGSVELMQFTGLLDKNGKEIYEGDWVVLTITDRFEHSDNIPEDCWGKIKSQDIFEGEVINSAPTFGIKTKGCNEGEIEAQVCGNNVNYGIEIEVIGNIYENPELLKSEA
jgi:uncharacterized phage protein (TIGR01671 family)